MAEQSDLVTTQATPVRAVVVHDDSEFAMLFDTDRFNHGWKLAQLFASSKLIPEHYRGNPSDTFIAIEMSSRLGISPLMLMQNTYIVHGKPGIQAQLATALINSSGLFSDPLDYEIEGDDPFKENYRVRAVAKRKATGTVVRGPWIDWQTVKAEGWRDKPGSKWKTMPGLMFQYRAATWFGRVMCPERLMGMQTTDELQDVGLNREPPAPAPSTDKMNSMLKAQADHDDPPVIDPEQILIEKTAQARKLAAEREALKAKPVETVPAHNPDTGEVIEEAPAQEESPKQWPDEIPAGVGLSYIEDAVLLLKPAKFPTKHAAMQPVKKAFGPHSWEKIAQPNRQEIWTAILNGSIWS